ncbi:glycoside hydrolase family 65 protein [Arthrobacter cryoconiti]|uniref:Glycoside hydrolase family 65 protein n=1 Tax=Arthrobacter cryoconiti TaxID=748907 RepID=A0ABV8QXM3_9MICC|nr:glycosyl hydrolase family 65 protein [Arthrobacter cryoconiti]MCC9069687.1 family 65 glycosyl hydrolase [Arthrobacter cryoconiti]
MINHPAYTREPWCLRETCLDLDVLAQSESLFALSNGHLGWRGNLDEGEPHGLPGTYLNGVYESRPMPYAEAGYGYPEAGQTVIDVTNGKLIRLLVDDQPFDIRYGDVLSHERVLDFRSGLLTREVHWVSPGGHGVRVKSQRLVSLTQRAIAAICYEVQALDQEVRIVLQSELVANEALPPNGGDPREAAALLSPLTSERHDCQGLGGSLLHHTQVSGLRVGAAMAHTVHGPAADALDRQKVTTLEEKHAVTVYAESFPDLARVTFTTTLKPGQRLRLIKFVAYGWSAIRSQPAVADQIVAALAGAQQSGWDGLVAAQRTYLDDFWARADVSLDGDARVQQAVRFALFHLLQAGARAEGRAIAAKGLTGPGYDGHAFWDTESYVLQVLSYTVPEAARDALRWRHSILPQACKRAAQLGLAGAVFPWRTIDGEECSGYWPAGTAAFHVGADIADAVVRYVNVTGDHTFEHDVGIELLVQTARLWSSLGHYDAQGGFCIDGVSGPDEYSAVADNNVYTNLMAAHNLRSAADAASRYPDQARELNVDEAESGAWLAMACSMVICYDRKLGVHPQSEGFTRHAIWDFAATSAEQYPLMLHVPYFDLYRKQVLKQADLVLAMHLRGEAFTAAQKARNFAYYEALTVRDSSLSACTQAVLAAETGHLELAYDYLSEAALMDLGDLEHNTRDGLHAASLAGTWIALVPGLAGLREREGTLAFTPRLPPGITGLRVNLCVRGQRLRVSITLSTTTYSLYNGEPLSLVHNGVPFTVKCGIPISLPTAVRQKAVGQEPTQPVGRAPEHQHARP